MGINPRLKIAHSGAVTRDLQVKQRRVAGCPQEPSPPHVGDSVMMYAPPRPGFPTKLQSCWQGPFIVVKCLEGNTFRIKHAKNFRQRLLRHRDRLRVLHTRPERLQPTRSENPTGSPTVVPTNVPPGPTVSVPPPSSTLHQSGQVKDSVIQEDTLSKDAQIRASQGPQCNIPAPSVPPAHLKKGTVPESCPALPLELRRGERSRRPPQRYGDWEPNPTDDDVDVYFIQ